jgi:SAM-dependent methyltransferase
MEQNNPPLFETLAEIHRRPEPWSEYTARELWTDPHTSQQMLAYHLAKTVDAASRNHAFLDRSARWIVSHFELTPGARIVDFGCGPGLYAQRLARAGLDVTGIDFSENSLAYARDAASREGLRIDYVHADYLEFQTDRGFDLVLMIMCDFCALNPDQRAALLKKFRSLLADGGKVLLDVYSPAMLDGRTESATWAPGPKASTSASSTRSSTTRRNSSWTSTPSWNATGSAASTTGSSASRPGTSRANSKPAA